MPCEWQFMRPPGRPQQSNFLVKMLITSFQKLAMVSDGAEFAVGNIEKWFKEAKHNTRVKLKKLVKYYNRRRRDVNIKVNDWVMEETHLISSTTKKVVTKFKPKFEGPYRVLSVQINNVSPSPKENCLGGLSRTTRIDTPDSSPNKRVDNSQSRIKGKDDPVITFPDRINTPDSSPDKKVTNSRSRVRGMEDPVITFPDKKSTLQTARSPGEQSEVLKRLDKGEGVTKLATEFNVGKASVGDINEWMEEDGETAEFLTDDDIAAAVTQANGGGGE
ncbi:hypothetical protein TNCV_406831 [Trichonephila clavipes]|nr:hypothetical protein TNCV_406831 [Trichonephila clavipes]